MPPQRARNRHAVLFSGLTHGRGSDALWDGTSALRPLPHCWCATSTMYDRSASMTAGSTVVEQVPVYA